MRCEWSVTDPLMLLYHDTEWGVPVHNDKLLFEHLALDSFQAGLSWLTILKKRGNFKNAFNNFSIEKIAAYDDKKKDELLSNQGIIRNRSKIETVINNARHVMEVQNEFGSFDHYIWQFVNYQTIHNSRKTLQELPATSPESDAMSKELKKRGFKFTGSTICYAFMQSVGMVNDHIISCFRYAEIKKL